jgi:hypothetical protein
MRDRHSDGTAKAPLEHIGLAVWVGVFDDESKGRDSLRTPQLSTGSEDRTVLATSD